MADNKTQRLPETMETPSIINNNQNKHPHHQSEEEKEKESKEKDKDIIYDLDDPDLRRKHGNAIDLSRPITCRFSAIPVPDTVLPVQELSYYGKVILESRNKLIVRVPENKRDLIFQLRNAWVNKYMAPRTPCTISWDLPRKDRERSTTVIIQQEGYDDGKGNGSSFPVTEGEDGYYWRAEDIEIDSSLKERFQRRRTKSLPMPVGLDTYCDHCWYLWQV
ncbi:hypothetical protein GGS20DRAFT_539578 [Poronia punctata]|nr:hypothetical protein GGS20DRAFT_539578 [Poronia punctata]